MHTILVVKVMIDKALYYHHTARSRGLFQKGGGGGLIKTMCEKHEKSGDSIHAH